MQTLFLHEFNGGTSYIRPEAGGLMVGLFEGKAAPWNVKSIPDHFSFAEIEPDWERMTPYLQVTPHPYSSQRHFPTILLMTSVFRRPCHASQRRCKQA